METPPSIPADAVLVWNESLECDEPDALPESNYVVVFELLEAHLLPTEVPRDSLRSYYVHLYYLDMQRVNGFADLLIHSEWDPVAVEALRSGLQAMGADLHVEAFDVAARWVEAVGLDRLEAFFGGELLEEEGAVFDFDPLMEGFREAESLQPLLKVHDAWLRSLPNLAPLSDEALQAEFTRRVEAVPDRAQRAARALEEEPPEWKLLRALCAKAEVEPYITTLYEPSLEGGPPIVHITSSVGHCHMVVFEGKAYLFRGGSRTHLLAEIDAPDAL